MFWHWTWNLFHELHMFLPFFKSKMQWKKSLKICLTSKKDEFHFQGQKYWILCVLRFLSFLNICFSKLTFEISPFEYAAWEDITFNWWIKLSTDMFGFNHSVLFDWFRDLHLDLHQTSCVRQNTIILDLCLRSHIISIIYCL